MPIKATLQLLNRPRHLSWLLLPLSFGVLAGVLGSLQTSYFARVDWLIMALCLLLISVIKPSIFKMLTIFLAGVGFGLYRGGQVQNSFKNLESWVGQTVQVQGFVGEDPTLQIDGDTSFLLKVESINGQQISGKIWVSSSAKNVKKLDIKRSDYLELSGRISPGFGSFPAAIYRADLQKIQRRRFADIAGDVRDNFSNSIHRAIQSPASDLGSGFLLGTKTRLPEKLSADLRLLALVHIVVASGYNLSILVRFSRRLLAKISRFTALAIASILVISFAYVTGWSPSMSRAAMITLISLATWYYGRKAHPLIILFSVAAGSVLINPSYLWGDLGWMLSFLAFTGVIIFSPMLKLYFWGQAKAGALQQVILETLSAQLFTAPLIIFVFGQYSPLALVANLLILPFIPLAMLFTFVAGLAGYLGLPKLITVLAWPAQTLLAYMIQIVDWLAAAPFASQSIQLGLTGLAMSYIGLLFATIYLYRRTGHQLVDYNIIQ